MARRDSQEPLSTLAMHHGLGEALLGSGTPRPARAENRRSRSQELKMGLLLSLPLGEDIGSWMGSWERWTNWRVQQLKSLGRSEF